jgi:hypothetical protein
MNNITMRKFAPTAVVMTVLLAASSTATAAPPIKEDPPEDFPKDLILSADTACPGFDLLVEATGSNANVRTFLDKKGNVVRILSAGRGYTLTYTRLDENGEPVDSVTIRPTGSNRTVVQNPDGTLTVTDTGTAGLILFSTDKPAGPSSTQYYGRIVYNIEDPGGENIITLLSTSGTNIDICAELAK